MLRLLLILALAFSMLSAASPAPAMDRSEHVVNLPGGKTLTYQIITPDGFKADTPYPVLLVLPPGPQTRAMADAALRLFDAESRTRGWVVVCPEAPEGKLFFKGGEASIPALLSAVRRRVIVEGNRFHVAGISNGGVSAFRLAIDNPEWFASVLTLPGYPPDAKDSDKLGRLKGIPVRMFVGSDDSAGWREGAKKAVDLGKAAGVDIELDVREAQPHIIGNLSGAELFTMLEPFRKKEGTMSPAAAKVSSVLDALHDAASKAEEARYFGLFAPEGVFLGTDASERWSVDEFRAYARPIFSKGKGWTYHPRDRHIDIAQGDAFAFFDELLDNDKYGVCRGTGVLRMIDGEWRIVQYHLTIPVPNELAERVARLIKAESGRKK